MLSTALLAFSRFLNVTWPEKDWAEIEARVKALEEQMKLENSRDSSDVDGVD